MSSDFNVLYFFIIFFGFFAVITAIVLISTIFLARARNKTPSPDRQLVEKETIKEVVMIPCQYCGSLMPQTALFCSNCGAGRKA